MTEQKLKEHFASQIAIRKLVEQELGSKIVVTPAEAKAFYDGNPGVFKMSEMVRASHILVSVDKKATAKKKLRRLKRLRAFRNDSMPAKISPRWQKKSPIVPAKRRVVTLTFSQKARWCRRSKTPLLQ